MGNIHGAMKRNLSETKLNDNEGRRNLSRGMLRSRSIDIPSVRKNIILLRKQSTNKLQEPIASNTLLDFSEKKKKFSRGFSMDSAQTSRTPLRKKISRMSLINPSVGILNNKMRAAITECWQTILEQNGNDLSKIGLEIYLMIFETCPELRKVFQIPYETKNISDHLPFHRSGKLLASLIDLCVRNIYKLEAEMGKVLLIYGRRHYNRQKQGFRLSYFPIFEECAFNFIYNSISDDQKTEELLEGWRQLLLYITSKMTEGVELGGMYEWVPRR